MHCAPNTIQVSSKTFQEREDSEEGEDWGLTIAINCIGETLLLLI